MTVRSLLAQGHNTLFFAEVDTPLLDALVLLAYALDATKEKVLAALPDPVDHGVEERFRGLVDRRCAGTPVSYIRRVKEFYGLEFYVDERVLVPRPDTEVLVEKVLQLVRSDPRLRRVHDACTGSGCVGISLKRAAPDLEVSASDISPAALEVAEMNARRILGGEFATFRSDLLDGVSGPFDVIAGNPPYLKDAEVKDMQALGWPEPELALRGGTDGTQLLARLIRSAPRRLAPGGWLLLEAAPPQFTRLYALMDQAGFHTIDIEKDLAGSNRVIAGRLSSASTPPSALLGRAAAEMPQPRQSRQEREGAAAEREGAAAEGTDADA
jgi:release factor glutamine methyltransferase